MGVGMGMGMGMGMRMAWTGVFIYAGHATADLCNVHSQGLHWRG